MSYMVLNFFTRSSSSLPLCYKQFTYIKSFFVSESQRSKYDPERSSIRSGQSFQQQPTTPSQYSGRLPGAPYGPPTNIRDPSNQNKDPRNQQDPQRDSSNQRIDARDQRRDPRDSQRDLRDQRRDPRDSQRDFSNQQTDFRNQPRDPRDSQRDLNSQYKNSQRDSSLQKGQRDATNYPPGHVERYPPTEPNRQPRSPEERTPPRREIPQCEYCISGTILVHIYFSFAFILSSLLACGCGCSALLWQLGCCLA